MSKFVYNKIVPLDKDCSEYNFITSKYINVDFFKKKKIIEISYKGLEILAEKAFIENSYFLRKSHLAQLEKILHDNESSENDKYVALELIKNAKISAELEFPMCQDTGTALVIAKKGQYVLTDFSDHKAISSGIYKAYRNSNLRYSQNSPISMYKEINTGTNLPAQIDIESVEGINYHFLFIAKGGGSANKTFLFQESKAVLNQKVFLEYICSKIKSLGTSACPPYHLAIVVGGTSAEYNLKTVKLASAGYLDNLPINGSKTGLGFRDINLEKKILNETALFKIGAQFGGKYFCHDIKVIRLPRHGASCPIGIGVSCSADRNIKGKITEEGIFLEKLERNPSNFLSKSISISSNHINVDLNRSIKEICGELTNYPIATRLNLNGKMIVARDIVHAKIKKMAENGNNIPYYFKEHIIYYAGPAKTPNGYISGSFGPTTAGRMDSYLPYFQNKGACLITLAKGNRSKEVVYSCKKNAGFYLGSIGGSAAKIGKECIKSMKILEYEELGMEAIYIIDVKNFPAFILIDDKGNDFFDNLP